MSGKSRVSGIVDDFCNSQQWTMLCLEERHLNRVSVSAFVESVAIDGDDPKHIHWIHKKSVERASEYNIIGVTYRLTQGTSII